MPNKQEDSVPREPTNLETYISSQDTLIKLIRRKLNKRRMTNLNQNQLIKELKRIRLNQLMLMTFVNMLLRESLKKLEERNITKLPRSKD